MHKATFLVLLALIAGLIASISACSGGASSTVAPSSSGGAGDAAQGKTVFNQIASPPCSSCHSIEPGVTLVGPSLAHMGSTAGSIEPGTSAEAYLRQSIVDPNAFLAPGFGGNIMPANYSTQLTQQQVDDLVAYLMTLK
jgi:mono/diheme cytochrome c family protein